MIPVRASLIPLIATINAWPFFYFDPSEIDSYSPSIAAWYMHAVLHCNVFVYGCGVACAGELDPDRVGSGIQYGNAQLRKVTPGAQQDKKDKCSC